MNLLYIIGEPGVGKTTLVRQLVLGRRRRVIAEPFVHTLYEDGLVQLGRDRQQFGGTDALSMSVQPKAVAALMTGVWPRVLGEGDRLANPSFFTAARAAGYRLDVVLLTLDPNEARARREARGSDQDERWLRGRATKISNLQPWVTITLKAHWPPEHLAQFLLDHPVLRPV